MSPTSPYVKDNLAWLEGSFPDFDFWHVPTSHGPDYWCWKPKGSDYGRESQHRESPGEVTAAITGAEGKRRAPARWRAEIEVVPE